MTFSIAAGSKDLQWFGVAVASRVLAVGRAVPAAAVDAGAVATQALCNITYRPRGIDMMRSGMAATDVVTALLADDPDRDSLAGWRRRSRRHVGFAHRPRLPALGRWPHRASIRNPGQHPGRPLRRGGHGAGLAGYRAGEALGQRLAATLLAGDRAGGDKRGRQSACILVVTRDGAHEAGRTDGHYDVNDEHTNLRVDDHPDPVFELARLVGLRDVSLAVRGPDDVTALTGRLLTEVAMLLDRVGHPPSGNGTEQVSSALREWAFSEDLDERLDAGKLPADEIDPVVLTYLRYRAGAAFAFRG